MTNTPPLSPPHAPQVLDLSHNRLTGPMPANLYSLATFSVQAPVSSFPRVLDLSYNNLYGPIPDFLFRALPSVVFACRCTPLLSLAGNPLTCPAASPIDSSLSLRVLTAYQMRCLDNRTGATYDLANWLSPGFEPLAPTPAPPPQPIPTGDAVERVPLSGYDKARTGATPPACRAAMLPYSGQDDGGPEAAYASGLAACPPRGTVPTPYALLSYTWREALAMTEVPPMGPEAMLPVYMVGGSSGKGGEVAERDSGACAAALTGGSRCTGCQGLVRLRTYLCAPHPHAWQLTPCTMRSESCAHAPEPAHMRLAFYRPERAYRPPVPPRTRFAPLRHLLAAGRLHGRRPASCLWPARPSPPRPPRP